MCQKPCSSAVFSQSLRECPGTTPVPQQCPGTQAASHLAALQATVHPLIHPKTVLVAVTLLQCPVLSPTCSSGCSLPAPSSAACILCPCLLCGEVRTTRMQQQLGQPCATHAGRLLLTQQQPPALLGWTRGASLPLLAAPPER